MLFQIIALIPQKNLFGNVATKEKFIVYKEKIVPRPLKSVSGV
jgi:hypothetical protein